MPEYRLRPYQQEMVDFAIPRLKNSDKPLLMNVGTGAGKTFSLSEMAKRWNGKTLVLTVSKELCEQDYEKLKIVNGENVGLYSASWNSRTVENITVATVQSAYKHPELFADHSLLILDECDCFPIDGCVSELLSGKKVCGLTATPYATVGSKQGRWYTTKLWPLHKIKSKNYGWFWQPVEYNLDETKLMDMGYLCPMQIYSTPTQCGLLRTQSNGSEYTVDSVNVWVRAVLDRIIKVMIGAEENGMCKSGLVFLPSVEACMMVEDLCLRMNISAGAITYKTDAKTRDKLVEAHKNGQIRWLVSQGCLARGFDSPATDCLIIARPTRSLRLHRQILGRGLRLSDGKEKCTVLDLTENCKSWGGPRDVQIGKAGWEDAILLRGKNIAGTEVSRLNLADLAKKKKTITPDYELNYQPMKR